MIDRWISRRTRSAAAGLALALSLALGVTPSAAGRPLSVAGPPHSVEAAALPSVPGATTWFFAEGNTLPDWFEFLTIANPDPAASLVVTIGYALEVVPGVADAPKTTTVTVPAGQRRTVEVFNTAAGGVGRDAPAPRGPGGGYTGVAAKLTAARPFVAERPMYFVNPFDIGVVNGAHDVLGVTAESGLWYFAEGSTLDGFQPFFTLQNARAVPSAVTITYATEGPDGTQARTLTLPPNSRTTIDIRGSGPGSLGQAVTGFGATIQASSPIVAERPFYVNRDIGGTGVINGAHNERGAQALSTTWTFAEGTALADFFEFLTLYNPSSLPADVEITYRLDGGSPQVRAVSVGPGRRTTVQVYNGASPGGLGRALPLAANPVSGGVSASLRSTNGTAFLAERPLYVAGHDFGNGPVNGAHDVLGFPGAGAARWTFAEGTVRSGFFEFLTLQNPGATPIPINVDYLVNGGAPVRRTITLPAARRTTVAVFGPPAQGGYGPPAEAESSDVGVQVAAVDGASLFVVERPMYVRRDFGALLVDDAHDTLGFADGLPPAPPPSPAFTVTSSDTNGFNLHVDLPAPTLYGQPGDDGMYAGISMGDMPIFPDDESDDIGKPGVPSTSAFFAVPEGADPSVQLLGSSSYELSGVTLFPAQDKANMRTPPQSDDPFFVPPFVKNTAFYQSDTPFPPSPFGMSMPGRLRDLRIGAVDVMGAQYKPLSKKLTIFTSFDFHVQFGGSNSHHFADQRVLGVWDTSFLRHYSNLLVNWQTVIPNLGSLVVRTCGEENLIVTTAALKPAADTLASFRNSQGLVSRVAVIGAGFGPALNTVASIHAFVQSRFNSTCDIRPSYLTVFGDVNQVTNSVVTVSGSSIGTDVIYTFMDGDQVQDLAYGRVPAQTIADAVTAVGKFISYEMTPSMNSTFYDTSFIGTNFEAGPSPTDTLPSQDNVEGTRVAEMVHDLLAGENFTVKRIYTKNDETASPTADNTGAPFPGDILESNGFDWHGTPNDITTTISNGTFLGLHYDHGGTSGWSHPNFTNSHLSTFTNADLPVLIAINCSSGTYDIAGGTQSWAERTVLKADGGAVGVIAHARTSYWGEEFYPTTGYYDALFPAFLPYGNPATSFRRMGDVTMHGMLRTIASYGGVRRTNYLTIWLGDPTTSIYISPPPTLNPGKFRLERLRDRIVVDWNLPDPPPDGTAITLIDALSNHYRGFLANGHAEILTPGATKGGAQLSFSRDDWVSGVMTVAI